MNERNRLGIQAEVVLIGDPMVIEGSKYRILDISPETILFKQHPSRRPCLRLSLDDETAFSWDRVAGVWRWNGEGTVEPL